MSAGQSAFLSGDLIMLDKVEVLRAACCVAGLDGTIGEKEMPLLQALATDAGVGAASFKAMRDRATSDRNYYEQQFRFLRGNPDESMKTMLRVAVADGELHANERVVLDIFAKKLGLSEERYHQLLTAAEQAIERGGSKTP